MTTFTDLNRTIHISMKQLDPERETLGADWSNELLDLGCLETDSKGAYIWHDLPGLVELALDWKYSTGAFKSDTPTDPGMRCVWIDGEYRTRPKLDPITRRPLRRYAHEISAASSSIREIRLLASSLEQAFTNISDQADPSTVSKVLAEIRRAETALAFASHIRWNID